MTTPTNQRLTSANRLSRKRDFDAVYAVRNLAAGTLVVVFGRRNLHGANRLGLSVGRRLGGAVARNRFKRLCREAFRRCRSRQPVGWDWIVGPQLAGNQAKRSSTRNRLGKLDEIETDLLRQMWRIARRVVAPFTDA